jgi:hypothetical protein
LVLHLICCEVIQYDQESLCNGNALLAPFGLTTWVAMINAWRYFEASVIKELLDEQPLCSDCRRDQSIVFPEKQEPHELIEKYLIEERSEEIYQSYIHTLSEIEDVEHIYGK